MNPKAACLKRREEEKADDGSAKGMQGPPHLGGGGGAGGGGPPPMIPFGSMPSSVSTGEGHFCVQILYCTKLRLQLHITIAIANFTNFKLCTKF